MKERDYLKKIGDIGENAAAEYLQSKGFAIWARNYRCKIGEIDIVAYKNGRLSFVEVKTRQNFNYGRPCEAITVSKQNKIRVAAQHYMKELEYRGVCPVGMSFDVIEVVVRHTENAF